MREWSILNVYRRKARLGKYRGAPGPSGPSGPLGSPYGAGAPAGPLRPCGAPAAPTGPGCCGAPTGAWVLRPYGGLRPLGAAGAYGPTGPLGAPTARPFLKKRLFESYHWIFSSEPNAMLIIIKWEKSSEEIFRGNFILLNEQKQALNIFGQSEDFQRKLYDAIQIIKNINFNQ